MGDDSILGSQDTPNIVSGVSFDFASGFDAVVICLATQSAFEYTSHKIVMCMSC